MFNISISTIYEHIKHDLSFPYINLGTKRRYLIDEKEFMFWYRNRTNREKQENFHVLTSDEIFNMGTTNV